MKHLKLFFALFAMLALGVGNAWADVNCDFTTKSASHGAYTDSWKYGDFTVFGGANNNKGWAYVKMGGKSTNLSQANPVYISSPKMTSAISKVQVSIIAGSLAKSGMSVNSWGVYVYSDANMTNQVDYVAGGTISKNAAVFEFTPTTGTTWSANNYYKVSFDLKNTTTTNGIIWVDKVTFVESTGDGGGGSDEPALSATPTEIDFGTVYQGTTVEDKTVAVNFENLTGAVTYSGLSTPFTATGAISATGDNITISADASTIGEYSQTLTVASTADSKTAEVTVKMNVVAAPAPTGTFTLHTGALVEGDYVIVSTNSLKAEVNSDRLASLPVTISNDEIVDPDATTIWHIAKSGEYWTLYNANKAKYAASTGAKNKAALLDDGSDDKALWSASGTSTYEFVNKKNTEAAVNANLRYNSQNAENSRWACYSTSTGAALSLYRKAGTKYNVNISATTNGTVTADPTSAEAGTTITLTVTPVGGYVLDALTVTDASSNTIEVADNKFTMPASDVTVTATFKENEKPAATLTLSKNGETEDITGYKQDDKVTLPSITSDCVKAFVGWSANASCATEPEYKAGDEYTLASTTQTLYAVYATVGGGETLTITPSAVSGSADPYTFTIDAAGYSLTAKKNGGSSAPTINASAKDVRIYAKGTVTLTAPKAMGTIVFNLSAQGKQRLAPITASVGTIAPQASGDATVTWTGDATEVTFTVGDKADFGSDGSSKGGQLCFSTITVITVGSYSNYSTTCAAAPKAEVNPTSVTANAAAVEGKVTVTYKNVNTVSVSVALYNDEACTEAFSADWLTASLDGDKNIAYTVAENTIYAERKAYIKLTAPETTGATDPAVVVIPVTQAAKDKVFASLEELVAAITPTMAGIEVTVTLTNEVIQDFYKSGSYTNGIALNVPYKGGVKVIEIYCKDVPVTWVKGGKVSGTITCPWKLYNSTWELCATAWTELTYTAPATVKSIAVSGTPTKTTYVDGEAFDPTGLVVTATLTDDSTEPIDVALVDWAFNPATLTKGETAVSVTATYNSVSSAAYEVTGLTVNDIPTKTVAEFIAVGGTRCYLEGIVSSLTEGNSMKYGNFDLTDASGTIYVYGCLNASGEKEKFADLGVKNGDKIKVIADEYELYGGTKDEAKNVQYVSHISAATITIADITMEVEEVITISATVEPAEAVVTYTIKENAANAISLSGNKITALAVGTATITASVAEGATYLGNSVDFTVTVNPQNIAVLPFEYNSGKAAIEITAGMTQEGLGSDYSSSPKIKFDDKDDYLIVHFDSEPGALSYTIKANVQSGNFTGGFDVQVSENGDDYDVLVSYTELEKTAAQKTHKLDKNVRYVKFVYTDKVSGQNVALGNILISKLSVLRADLYDGKWGTFCPDQKVTYMQGASFYTLTYLEMKDGMPYKLFFDEITTDYLEAGKPYLFIAEGEEIKGVKSGEVVSIASNYNGFYGNVSGNTISLTTTQTEYVADGDVVNNYGVINSRFTLLGNGTNVAHERAHVQIKNGQLDCPNPPASLPALAPGTRRVVAGATGINTATGVDQVQGDNVPTKTIINGQLFILRGEKMYDAQGKLVK